MIGEPRNVCVQTYGCHFHEDAALVFFSGEGMDNKRSYLFDLPPGEDVVDEPVGDIRCKQESAVAS